MLATTTNPPVRSSPLWAPEIGCVSNLRSSPCASTDDTAGKENVADKKTVFVAFAIEDERQRDFLKDSH